MADPKQEAWRTWAGMIGDTLKGGLDASKMLLPEDIKALIPQDIEDKLFSIPQPQQATNKAVRFALPFVAPGAGASRAERVAAFSKLNPDELEMALQHLNNWKQIAKDIGEPFTRDADLRDIQAAHAAMVPNPVKQVRGEPNIRDSFESWLHAGEPMESNVKSTQDYWANARKQALENDIQDTQGGGPLEGDLYDKLFGKPVPKRTRDAYQGWEVSGKGPAPNLSPGLQDFLNKIRRGKPNG